MTFIEPNPQSPTPPPHLSTIHPDRLFSCDENLQSPNDDGNVTIDLDSDSNHSNHSDVSNSYLFNFCERTNANLISMDEREHKSITQDDFKLLTEFKHHQTPGSASAPRSMKKDWNEVSFNFRHLLLTIWFCNIVYSREEKSICI